MDRLSNLPDLAIERILEGLPLIDRIRTSVLSSAWKSRWAKLSSLPFDRESYCSLSKGKQDRASVNYIKTTSYLVQQHIGPLREFIFYLPCFPQTEFKEVNSTIADVLLKGVEILSLLNSGNLTFRLPSSVFSSVKLTHLKLKNCIFYTPYSFEGLPNLISLDFDHIRSTADEFARFVSSCPQLQTIILERLKFSGQILCLDAPNLVFLRVKGSFKSLYLENAQKLVYLCITGSFEYISLQNAQNLQTLSVLRDYKCDATLVPSAAMCKFFKGLAEFQRITLGGHFFQLLADCGDPITSSRFDELTILNLDKLQLCNVEDAQRIFSLVESCPILKELNITMDEVTKLEADDQIRLESEIKRFGSCTFQHLVRVHIEVIGTITEIKMIEAFLGCSPILELMSISLTSKKKYAGENRKLFVLERANRCCRASPKAKVVYLKKNETLAEALAN